MCGYSGHVSELSLVSSHTSFVWSPIVKREREREGGRERERQRETRERG